MNALGIKTAEDTIDRLAIRVDVSAHADVVYVGEQVHMMRYKKDSSAFPEHGGKWIVKGFQYGENRKLRMRFSLRLDDAIKAAGVNWRDDA